jgi:integrase
MTGSLPIDLQFRGVGRLHLRSGTTKRQTRDAMKQMLRTLYQVGRLDVLRDLKAHHVSVMQVYEQYRQGKLNELPTGDLMRPLDDTWTEWLEGRELADRTRRDYAEAWTRLAPAPAATFCDLPALLAAHRKACLGVRARTFGKDRAAVLAFVHTMLGDTHWLALACRRVAPLKITKDRRLPYNPLTVAQAKTLAASLAPHHALTLWGFCLTGMRPEEMFEEHGNRWSVEEQAIRVHGSKSLAADRVVPRVGLLVKPATGRLAFYRALRTASAATVSPYDLRRTYAQWLDLARIPQFRQDYYMAHGPKDLNALYKRMRGVGAYLVEDAAALGGLVGEPVVLRMVK